ncbi:DUF1453 family protein [Paenibacillus sp. HJL G12]|uniref:DUF1453 family protein n=1 Tax=Paenibacillus dendrobii TaxID=2691084 RepID=A0A7X3IHS9_9BACL|nr:CcdC protein domain-containing protein [Paenibacillus dendrobii]MWV44187.1 DUF1453 family protein [Paenibacillus dendrobii]
MNNYTSYIIIIVLVLWMSGRERTVKPATMWIMPVLWASMVFPAVQWHTIDPASIGLYAVCAVVGLALGVVRGKLEKMRIRQDGSVSVQGSMVSILIFIAVLVLRMIAEHWGQTHSLVSLANALLFIPLGSICARRFIIYQRYQALMTRRSM